MARFFLISWSLIALLHLAQSIAMPQQDASAIPGLTTAGINCDIQTERRDTKLSGTTIAQSLRLPDELLRVCLLPSGDGALSVINDLEYSIRSVPKTDSSTCRQMFNNIVQKCIVNRNYWGGRYFDPISGFQFDVTNTAYPVKPAPVVAKAPVAPQIPTGATVVTQTVGQSTLAATFVPTTLADYAGLTQATTITATTTQGGIPLQYPLAIGIAGVAWAMLGEAAVVGVVPPMIPPGGVSPEAPDVPEPETPQTVKASPTSIIPTVTVIPEAPINELPGLQVVMNAPTGPLPTAADPLYLDSCEAGAQCVPVRTASVVKASFTSTPQAKICVADEDCASQQCPAPQMHALCKPNDASGAVIGNGCLCFFDFR